MDCIQNDASNNSSNVAYVFFDMGMYLLSHCLVTELLLSNDRGDTHTDTQTARQYHKPTFIFSKYGK
jgi:hypothetical protein